LLESKIDLEQVLEQVAAQERISERCLEVVHYRKEFVQILYPIARNRRQFFVVGDDYFDVDVGPAIALTRKRAYDGQTLNAVIIAQQVGYSLCSLFSLFGRKQGHFPPFYSTRECLVAASAFAAYCGAEEER